MRELHDKLEIGTFARAHRVRFVRKDRSRLMRFLGWLLGVFGYSRFMAYTWTAVGRTIYYPTGGPNADLKHLWPDRIRFRAEAGGHDPLPMPRHVYDHLENFRSAVEHEFHHVIQFERLWHLHSLFYLLGMPLPFGLAWYRWRCERVAYLHQLRHYTRKGNRPGGTLPPHALKRGLWQVDIDRTVNTLWRVYGWCWPKAWMRRWFRQQLVGFPNSAGHPASDE